MAVLIEAISVIIKAERLDARYPGGWPAFEASPPNRTLCADGDLIRVGFMDPREVERFVAELRALGLQFSRDDPDGDVAVVDQKDAVLLARDGFRTVGG